MSGITNDRNDPGLKKIESTGQQEKYLVLSEEERAKGFIRPVRESYKHIVCDGVTTMSQDIAETYARNPSFYGGTFCMACSKHFDLVKDGKRQFLWNDESGVGE